MKRIEKWRPIVKKFNKKMSSWKAKTLSIGGRLTIVSNIMGGIPNYWLSMFPIPKAVANNLESLRRDFFWGPKEEGKPISWVRWNKACLKRKNGGLGIIGIEDMNVSLLAKWVWRFRNEDQAVWVQIIKSIHGKDGSFGEEQAKKMHSCIWRSILLKMQKLDPIFLNLTNIMQVNIGDGDSTRFWEDSWNDKGILKRSFPRLFALEVEKEVKVKDRIMSNVEDWNRRRDIRGGREREEATALKMLLEKETLTNTKDRWMVPGAPNNAYSTKWLRDCLETHKTMGQEFLDIWNKWIPKKCNVFIWRLIQNKIPTRKTLSDIGIDIPCTLCPLCEEKEEDLKHLFLECLVTASYWQVLGNWWKISIPIFNRIEDLFIWSRFAMKKKVEGSWFQVVILAVLVSIWKFRNGVIFEKKSVTGERNFRDFIELSFLWLNSRNPKFRKELSSWIQNPNCIM